MGDKVLYSELYYTINADHVDAVVWSSVPIGSIFVCDDDSWQVNDGTFQFTTDKAGIYIILAVLPEPYKSLRFEITALALNAEVQNDNN